jgi:hypothetical protein
MRRETTATGSLDEPVKETVKENLTARAIINEPHINRRREPELMVLSVRVNLVQFLNRFGEIERLRGFGDLFNKYLHQPATAGEKR